MQIILNQAEMDKALLDFVSTKLHMTDIKSFEATYSLDGKAFTATLAIDETVATTKAASKKVEPVKATPVPKKVEVKEEEVEEEVKAEAEEEEAPVKKPVRKSLFAGMDANL